MAPIELIDNKEFDCGSLLVFDKEFLVSYADGMFAFSDYVIDTQEADDDWFDDEPYDPFDSDWFDDSDFNEND